MHSTKVPLYGDNSINVAYDISFTMMMIIIRICIENLVIHDYLLWYVVVIDISFEKRGGKGGMSDCCDERCRAEVA